MSERARRKSIPAAEWRISARLARTAPRRADDTFEVVSSFELPIADSVLNSNPEAAARAIAGWLEDQAQAVARKAANQKKVK